LPPVDDNHQEHQEGEHDPPCSPHLSIPPDASPQLFPPVTSHDNEEFNQAASEYDDTATGSRREACYNAAIILRTAQIKAL